MKKNLSVVIFLAVTLLLAGCTAIKNDGSKVELEVEEPEWAVLGSGVYSSRKGMMFHGVGMANEYRNFSLLQAFSENRAKAELEMVLEDFTSALTESFMDSQRSVGSDTSSNRYQLELELDVIKSATLDEAEVVEGWLHPNGGKGYALMSVSLERFMELIEKSDKLSKEFKSYVDEKAEAFHEALSKQQVN